jgi:NAD(P)-dependent dehydrogenase (short-subunit alcohol dehydrogenase family)
VAGSLEGLHAVVTGGGTGIGAAIATALAADGASLTLMGRRHDRLAAHAATLPAARALACDVTDEVAVAARFAEAAAQGGPIAILVNNAGAAESAPFQRTTLAQFRRMIDVNLTGAFLCTQEAVRMMKNQEPRGGRIINNGSISAHVPRPNSAPYTATKHAITGLTRSTALDGRKFDIACGQIDIGNAGTNMTARMSVGVPQADGSLAVEPTIDPQHIARAVAYMASLPLDANVPFITVMATKMPYIGRG